MKIKEGSNAPFPFGALPVWAKTCAEFKNIAVKITKRCMKLPFKNVDFVLFSLKNMSPMTKKSMVLSLDSIKVYQPNDDSNILRQDMRIEQVIQQYNNQGFNQPGKSRKPFALKAKSKPHNSGCIDMICLSPDQENEYNAFDWILAYVHLISEDRMKEWMKKLFCQPCSPDDLIIEKLLIEVL
jgi:hypothetical protein